jgi:UDP-glucose 4-epimerase
VVLDVSESDCNRARRPGRALVTGADGFVGRALCERLLAAGWGVTGAVRDRTRSLPAGVTHWPGGPIETADWAAVLPGHDTLLHLAARVPDVRGDAAAYRRTNVEATVRLARAALRADVARFVFASTIKVHGDRPATGPLREDSALAPSDAYGRSKLEAEVALHAIAAGSPMRVTVVRPCLVYGAGVRGNLLRLIGWVDRGAVLPFAGLDNRRSLVSVWSLADLLARCAEDPRAAGATYVAADDPPVSTPELLRAIASALGVRSRLVRLPAAVWSIAARLPRLGDAVARLAGSLEVDASLARSQLDWQPAVPLADGLARTARWYRARSPHRVAAKVAESA